jgi:hypothetical protein
MHRDRPSTDVKQEIPGDLSATPHDQIGDEVAYGS